MQRRQRFLPWRIRRRLHAPPGAAYFCALSSRMLAHLLSCASSPRTKRSARAQKRPAQTAGMHRARSGSSQTAPARQRSLPDRFGQGPEARRQARASTLTRQTLTRPIGEISHPAISPAARRTAVKARIPTQRSRKSRRMQEPKRRKTHRRLRRAKSRRRRAGALAAGTVRAM